MQFSTNLQLGVPSWSAFHFLQKIWQEEKNRFKTDASQNSVQSKFISSWQRAGYPALWCFPQWRPSSLPFFLCPLSSPGFCPTTFRFSLVSPTQTLFSGSHPACASSKAVLRRIFILTGTWPSRLPTIVIADHLQGPPHTHTGPASSPGAWRDLLSHKSQHKRLLP